MSQCFTDPTLTLFGTSSFLSAGESLFTSIRETTVLPAPIVVESSVCFDTATESPFECTSYVTFTTTVQPTGPVVFSTITEVLTVQYQTEVITVAPTATQYTTSCTASPDPNTVPRLGTTTTPTPTPTPAQGTTTTPAVVIPSATSVKVEVSSNPVTITNSRGDVSISVRVQTVSVAVAVAGDAVTNLNASSSSSTPIGPIVGGVVGGLLLIAALVGFLIRRKTKRNRISARDDDDDEGYGIGRRNSGRGEKIERKRLDLAEEDLSPGRLEPFTYTDASTSVPYHPDQQQQQQQPQRHLSNASGPSSSVYSSDHGPLHPYPQSDQSQSPPPSLTSAQAKALEAHRSRSAQSPPGTGASGSGGGEGPSLFREDEEEVVVHQDAGPMRVDLPPVYDDRSGA
ncbi:hypothetical protein BDY24DRAFT_439240 [Mrakia frigida]|uniref:uncharacterized protein n=1 Tax=Mrakia frigida TaxID=29902 RepID=UPI003FCBF4E3